MLAVTTIMMLSRSLRQLQPINVHGLFGCLRCVTAFHFVEFAD